MQQSNDAPPFQVQEIDQPGNDWKIHETSPPATYQADRQELELAEKPNSGLPEELRSSTISPKVSRLQSRRMENFSYEPLSVPTSRVSLW